MPSVSGLGPVIPPSGPRGEPHGDNKLSQSLEKYAELFANPESQNLEKIAEATVELDKLARSVIHTASPKIRSAASDLEHILQSPLSENISILTASKNYLENPTTLELGKLIKELYHNSFALARMCDELALLSNAIKNPTAL